MSPERVPTVDHVPAYYEELCAIHHHAYATFKLVVLFNKVRVLLKIWGAIMSIAEPITSTSRQRPMQACCKGFWLQSSGCKEFRA